MGEAREIGCSVGIGKGGERTAMDRERAVGRDRFLNGEPRELVAKHDSGGSTGACRRPTILQIVGGATQGASSSQSSACGGTSATASSKPSSRSQSRPTGKHSFANRRRDAITAAGEHLDHEKRIPTCRPVELAGVDPVWPRELTDSISGERRELQPRHRALRGELAERSPQRMAPLELVVAERENDERRDLLDLADQDAQNVERRLVRPVNIFESKNGGAPSCKRPREGPYELVQLTPLAERLSEVATEAIGDVEKRSQRLRREEWIARSPEDLRALRVVVAELTQQSRLADPGFTADEHERTTPVAVDVRNQLGEHSQLALPLEQSLPGDHARCQKRLPQSTPRGTSCTAALPGASS
jgi:hypothetical protein